ncbi:MAG TPA: thiamine-phosphate kinase [bacterium]|nr:thiamine-phosphate kinase [bacterium]
MGGLGEFALIDRLSRLVPTVGPGVTTGVGDDTAVLSFPGRALATCDAQVEGVHFRFGLSTPADVGWRALAVNVSDIAAMGGTPRYALVSLLVPRRARLRDIEGIYRGLGQAARAYGVVVAGGNVSGTDGPIVVDVTVLGNAGRTLTRGGARPADGLWVTGSVGKAAAGLFLAGHPRVRVPGGRALRAAYRRPVPRVAAGRALSASAAVTAAIDISDGTAADLLHVLEASGVGVRLDVSRVPVPPGLAEAAAAARVDPSTWALGGGEDFELLFTARPSFDRSAAAVARAAGVPVTRIGEIVPSRGGRWVIGPTGRRTPLIAAGWDHLKARTRL